MADGFIVRKGGVTTEQALAPTITEVSTTQTSITFTITNNDGSTAVILYEVDDATPDENSIELAAAATSGSLTISGLSPGTVDLYATANVTGKVKSNVTEKEFTLVIPFTAATGGTTAEYDDGGKRYKSHTFNSDGTFTVTTVGDATDDRNKAEFLIIAGGGSGKDIIGFTRGGGGGAGGFRTTTGTQGELGTLDSKVVLTAQAYSIDVGSGGSNSSGDNSSALGITALGGGGSGFDSLSGTNRVGLVGGSGGGGAGSTGAVTTESAGGAGTANQGFAGGAGNIGGNVARGAGGGGGAGQAGFNSSSGSLGPGGNGGNGLANTLRDGTSETRAGGGGGGSSSQPGGTGGSGGGGTGGNTVTNQADSDFTSATAGTANTGSGGGGADNSSKTGANGGSGIVVIRYEIATV